MAFIAGAEIVVTVEKPVIGGRMLARHDGRVVLVAGAVPGERVRARIDKVSRQVAFAETVAVLDRSSDRRDSSNDWACGGSLYAHISYQRQRELKSDLVADAFTRIGKLPLRGPVAVLPSREDGYRMRARLHARDGRFGFFREGSHELCDAASTRQLLPGTIAAIHELEARLHGVALTSCELSENAAADERTVLVELAAGPHAPPGLNEVAGVSGLLFTSHHSTQVETAYGSPYVTDRIDLSDRSAMLSHHVQSFFQGNRYLLDALVNRVLSHVPDGDVIDLYAGVGLFAVSLAARGVRRITAVEGDRSSAHDLARNAAPFGEIVSVEHVSVERYLEGAGSVPDTLVLDPPRTGISSDAMGGILRLTPPRVVYVSCDLATVARDVRRLVDAGYSLAHIEAFDLFPNTAHVETLVVLERGVQL